METMDFSRVLEYIKGKGLTEELKKFLSNEGKVQEATGESSEARDPEVQSTLSPSSHGSLEPCVPGNGELSMAGTSSITDVLKPSTAPKKERRPRLSGPKSEQKRRKPSNTADDKSRAALKLKISPQDEEAVDYSKKSKPASSISPKTSASPVKPTIQTVTKKSPKPIKLTKTVSKPDRRSLPHSASRSSPDSSRIKVKWPSVPVDSKEIQHYAKPATKESHHLPKSKKYSLKPESHSDSSSSEVVCPEFKKSFDKKARRQSKSKSELGAEAVASSPKKPEQVLTLEVESVDGARKRTVSQSSEPELCQAQSSSVLPASEVCSKASASNSVFDSEAGNSSYDKRISDLSSSTVLCQESKKPFDKKARRRSQFKSELGTEAASPDKNPKHESTVDHPRTVSQSSKPELCPSSSMVAVPEFCRKAYGSDCVSDSEAGNSSHEESKKPFDKKARRLSKSKSELGTEGIASPVKNPTHESTLNVESVDRSRKRTVSQSNKSEFCQAQSSSMLPAPEFGSNASALDSVSDSDAGKSVSKKARRSSVSMSCSEDGGGEHVGVLTLEQGDLSLRKRKSSISDRGEPPKESSPGKLNVDPNLDGILEHSFAECFVKLTRVSDQDIQRLSPKSTKKDLKSSGTDGNFAVPAMPPVKKMRTGGGKPKSVQSSKSENTSVVAQPPKNTQSVVRKDPPESSLDIFRNLYKPKAEVDPLSKVDMETNDLDFEPGGEEDDDAISMFAESTLFGPEFDIAEKYPYPQCVHDDNSSEASYGSSGSRDMEIDEDLDDNDSQSEEVSKSPPPRECELGFEVENYVVAESQSSKTESREVSGQKSCDVVEETTVPAASSRTSPNVVNHLSDMHCNDRNADNLEKQEVSIIVESNESKNSPSLAESEDLPGDRAKENCEVETKTLDNDGSGCSVTQYSSLANVQPQKCNQSNPNYSRNKSEMELVFKAPEVINCSTTPDVNLDLKSQGNSSSDALTSDKLPRVLSLGTSTTGMLIRNHSLDKSSDERNFKKPVPVNRDITADSSRDHTHKISDDRTLKKRVPVHSNISGGSETSLIQHGPCTQPGGPPVVQLVNPQPRGPIGAAEHQRSNRLRALPDQRSEAGPQLNAAQNIEWAENRHALPPAFVNNEGPCNLQRRNDKPALLPLPDLRPTTIPNPENSRHHLSSAVANMSTQRPVDDARVALLPTPPTAPSLLANAARLFRASSGNTPPPNVDGRFTQHEASPYPVEYSLAQRQPPRCFQPLANPAYNLQENFMRREGHTGLSIHQHPQDLQGLDLEPQNTNPGPSTTQPLQDPLVLSRTDIDMRLPHNEGSVYLDNVGSGYLDNEGSGFLNNEGSGYLDNYCRAYLRTGECFNATCQLHELPAVFSSRDKLASEILKSVQDMVKPPFQFWMNQNLPDTIKNLGSFGENDLLVNVCELLWKRDLSLGQEKNYEQYSSHWAVLAEAFCHCGLSRSKAVEQILITVTNQAIMPNETTKPKSSHFDVIDNIIMKALFEGYIKCQICVWESISPLLILEGYEIPIEVMSEVLKDTMRGPREKPELKAICDYLLKSPAVKEYRRDAEKEYKNLLHAFICALQQDYNQKHYADKLSVHFDIRIDQAYLRALPVFYSPPVVGNNNTTNRFTLQNWGNRTPVYTKYTGPWIQPLPLPAPVSVSTGQAPTPCTAPQGGIITPKKDKNEGYNFTLGQKETSSSTEEEVSSSTEGISGPSEMTTDHEGLNLEQANPPRGNASRYEPIRIVAIGSGRVATRGVPIATLPDQSQRQPDITLRPLGDAAVTTQYICASSDFKAKPSTKLAEGITPIDTVSKPETRSQTSTPSTKGKVVTGGRGSSSKAAPVNNNLKNAKVAKQSFIRPKNQSVVTLIEKKLFGKAAGIFVNWLTPEQMSTGISHVFETFKKFDHLECIDSFKALLNGVTGHMSGTSADGSLKSVISSIGLLLLQNFMYNHRWYEAQTINDLLSSKMEPLEVEMELFSKSSILLMRSEFLFHLNKFPESLKIAEENKFFSSPENWTCPKKDADIQHRNRLCLMLFDKCMSASGYSGKVDNLFKLILDAKESFQLDVGTQYYSAVLKCLVHAKCLSSALALLFWADNHHLKPDPLTCRLLLGEIFCLSAEQKKSYSPHVLYLLSIEPYKEALPPSFQGIDRATMSLQSSWFDWEVKAIITFLINCHLCNLPISQDIPEIEIKIKAADLPVEPPGEAHFPHGLIKIDPSLLAMKERALQALKEFQLVNKNEVFPSDTLLLDRSLVRERVNYRRSEVRGKDKFTSLRGRGILNASAGSRPPPASHQPPYMSISGNYQQIQGSGVEWFHDARQVGPAGEGMPVYGTQAQYTYTQNQGMPMNLPQFEAQRTTQFWNPNHAPQNVPPFDVPHNSFSHSRGSTFQNRRGQSGRGRGNNRWH